VLTRCQSDTCPACASVPNAETPAQPAIRPVLSNGSALLNVSQMAEADRLSVEAGISAFDLMANAGAAVAHAIITRWTTRPLLVLCGPGNNGGDGFVAAQRLAEAGWPVRVAMFGARESLKGEAHRHAERWQGNVEALGPEVLEGAELIVDALFGAGLRGPLTGAALDTLAAVDKGHAPMIAIDVPSGARRVDRDVLPEKARPSFIACTQPLR
jgi:hydroxyethylthiazole kinase-like uncharacterized protein yjeF